MKVLLFNDTRVELNPGCHATVDELSKFINENLINSTIEYVPLGTEYNLFSEKLFKRKRITKYNDLLSKILKKIKITNPIILKHFYFDFNKWKNVALNDFSSIIKDKIKSSDLIIINMEGTIHHNSVGGLTLMGLAYYSKKKNKKVALVNGSYQLMDEQLTLKVLKEVNFISVREVNSYYYLIKKGLNVCLIPDFAFRANINSNLELKNIMKIKFEIEEKKKCLYTIGVLGVYQNQRDYVNFDVIKRHILDIKQLGYTPYYLKIEDKEGDIEKKLYNLGVNIISYEDGITYKNIGTVLNSFDLLITGRYHIGIFGLMNKIPTFFLKSNTYKIEGLLKMLNIENNMIINDDILSIENKINYVNAYKLPLEESYIDFKRFLNAIDIKNK